MVMASLITGVQDKTAFPENQKKKDVLLNKNIKLLFSNDLEGSQVNGAIIIVHNNVFFSFELKLTFVAGC